MISRWRAYLKVVGRAAPSLSWECVFDTIEWQTAYVMVYKKTPPQEIPTLKEVLKIIARLGGFLRRKHDGDPGPTVMWKGARSISKRLWPYLWVMVWLRFAHPTSFLF